MATATEADIVTFVKTFLPEEQHSGRVEREISRLNATLKNDIASLVGGGGALHDRINNNWALLQQSYSEACRVWNRLSPQQQTEVHNQMAALWVTTTLDMQRIIRLLTDWFNAHPPGTPRFFSASLQARLAKYQENQVVLANTRDQQSTPTQAYGVKVRAVNVPSLDQALWQRFKSRVFPPDSLLRSNVRTGPITAALPTPADLQPFRRAPAVAGMWQCTKIGQGGQGTAWAHEFYDTHQNIVDRVVQKDSTLLPSNAFNDPRHWHGDTTVSPAAGNCVPMEAHVLGLMGEVPPPEADNTIKLLAAPQVVFEPHNRVRLYMEYANHGDLAQLVRLHARHREPVPEMFIWLVFRALLNNALIMEQGGIAGKRNPWSQIVHCDLKAVNVFLGPANEDYYPHYPTPKLGDFGLAFPTNSQDEFNPELWTGRGTRGHYAPEQIYWIDDIAEESMNDDKMLSPCNIYGLATIIYQLIERRRTRTLEQPFHVPESNQTMYEISAEAHALYEPIPNDYGLCTLVSACLNSNPDLRPTADFLLFHVNATLRDPINNAERLYGQTEVEDDTLLLPKEEVNLKWVSRLLGGVGRINEDRIPLDLDEEMGSDDDEEEDDDDDSDDEMEESDDDDDDVDLDEEMESDGDEN